LAEEPEEEVEILDRHESQIDELVECVWAKSEDEP
jgi:hypothetical protein